MIFIYNTKNTKQVYSLRHCLDIHNFYRDFYYVLKKNIKIFKQLNFNYIDQKNSRVVLNKKQYANGSIIILIHLDNMILEYNVRKLKSILQVVFLIKLNVIIMNIPSPSHGIENVHFKPK